MKQQPGLDALILEYWQFVKESYDDLKEHVEELENFIEGKEDEEAAIQTIYEEIIPPTEAMKEYLHKIFILKLMEKRRCG